jgi:hypothetical protein
VDAADSLSARMVEALGIYGSAAGFREAEAGEAKLPLDTIAHLARRVGRLEDALSRYRDRLPPANPDFENLRRRLADHGIEEQMTREDESEELEPARDDDPEED